MRTRHIAALLLAALAPAQAATAADDFAAFLRGEDKGVEQFTNQTVEAVEGEKAAFEAYRRELLDAFENYRRAAAAVWGEKGAVVPQKSNWVEYGGDMRERSVVDFEKGVVRVEVALDPAQAKDGEKARQQLQKNIMKTLILPPDERSIIEVAREPGRKVEPGMGRPLLDGQVAGKDGQPLEVPEVKEFARQKAEDGAAQPTTVKGADGKERVVVAAEFPLIPNHLKKRAEQFRKPVHQYAGSSRLDHRLVYAVMETESYFNPTARSAVPAFGLMQLVPTSGARDAYRHLHNEDRLVTDTYLYQPENNIQLGSGYLSLLYYSYFEGITDPTARLWCAISGYNTGPGNVMRAFVGKYSGSQFGSRANWNQQAIAKANAMTPQQVYDHLRANLPYEETRTYLEKVSGRMEKYAAL